MRLSNSHVATRFLIHILLALPCACLLLSSCATNKEPKAETPITDILICHMNHQQDAVKTQRFVERVGQQSFYIAEPTLAAGLAHINSLPAKEQNTASAYIRSWQALRYFKLELSAGYGLQAFTAWTILETLEKSTWASLREQAVRILARTTGYEPDEPRPNPFREADEAGGPRPGSLKNLNEAVRKKPCGLITPVRQTCCEDEYYDRLGQTYRQIMTEQGKRYQQYLKTLPPQPAPPPCP